MATKVDERNYRTSLDLGKLRQVVSASLTGRIDISPLQYDALEDPDDVGVLVTRDALFGGNAAVQVCMNDAGGHRIVTLNALGSGSMDVLMNGSRNSVKMKASQKLLSEIEAGLRSSDPTLTAIS